MATSTRRRVGKPAVEFRYIPTEPRRQNYDMGHFRNAIKIAEQVLFPQRTELYDIYTDILIDTHLTAVIEQREDALLSERIVFSENGKENELINDLLELPFFEDMILEIFRKRLWGHSLMWIDLSGAQFNDFKLIDRKHVIPEKGLFVERQYYNNGIDFTQPPYTFYTLAVGGQRDLGLLLKAVPWVLLKRGDVSDWASFNEIFANPIRKGSYPLYNDDAKKELMEGLRDLGAFGSVVHPKETDLELLIANAAGSAETYEKLQIVCDKQLSKLLVGQTMTTDDGSSKSQGEVHERVGKAKTEKDRRLILNTLNTQFKELLELHGFNPGKGKFHYKKTVNLTELKARLDIDEKVAQKVEIEPEYWYETYNLPVPKTGAKLKEPLPIPIIEKQAEIEDDGKKNTTKARETLDKIKSFFE